MGYNQQLEAIEFLSSLFNVPKDRIQVEENLKFEVKTRNQLITGRLGVNDPISNGDPAHFVVLDFKSN